MLKTNAALWYIKSAIYPFRTVNPSAIPWQDRIAMSELGRAGRGMWAVGADAKTNRFQEVGGIRTSQHIGCA